MVLSLSANAARNEAILPHRLRGRNALGMLGVGQRTGRPSAKKEEEALFHALRRDRLAVAARVATR